MNNGHGEGDTKWNGWAWKLLLCAFNMKKIFGKTHLFLIILT